MTYKSRKIGKHSCYPFFLPHPEFSFVVPHHNDVEQSSVFLLCIGDFGSKAKGVVGFTRSI